MEVKHYHGNDGSDDSSDDENMGAASIEKIKMELASSPSNYDKHLELVNICKEHGELDELRSARQNFAKVFPLIESLWLEWIADEAHLVESEEEHEKLVQLYETATQDYLSPDVWLGYIEYAIRWLGQEGGLVRFRTLCERAITHVGLHPEKGAAIWEIYRETENALDSDDKTEKVGKILRRQIGLPLYDNEGAYKELKQLDQERWKQSKTEYDTAKMKLKEIDVFEAKLRLTDKPAELGNIWGEYLQYEIKKGDPVRIEFAYDRATSQLCLNPALWLEFISWARKMKSPNVAKITKRAVRNCSWDEKLWLERMIVAESCGDDIEKVFDSAIECLEGAGINSLSDILWQLLLSSRRKLSHEPTDDEKTSFRAVARKVITATGSDNSDVVHQFETFAADVEVIYFDEIARARSKWEKLVKTSYGQDGCNWVRYAELEQYHGDLQLARKIYKRGVQFSKTNCLDLFAKASHFERLHGSQSEFEIIQTAITKKTDENIRREQKEIWEKEKAQKRAEKQSKKVGKTSFKAMAFVKQIDDVETAEPPVKKSKHNSTPDRENGSHKPEPMVVEFKSPMPMAPPTGLPMAFGSKKRENPKKRPPPKEPQPNKPIDIALNGPKADPNQPKFKHAETPEEKERTVYISNMDYKLKNPEADLRKIFIGCGEIEEVRLIKNGVLFRGYGYVCFKEKEGHDNALLRDRAKIHGRPCFVSKFTEPGEANKKDFKFNDGKEDHRVFVKHPKLLTVEQIKEVFESCGTVIDTRLPETREGRRKLHFYVEFATALEAVKANLMLHQKEFFGYPLEVQVSNPPKRGQPTEPKVIDISKTAYATPRSKFNLVPRNIKSNLKKSPSHPKPEDPPKAEVSAAKPKSGMSNADFANLFSK